MTIGWIAVIFSILAFWGHFAPGVMSLAGWFMSLGALGLSVLSVPKAGKTFFNVTLILTLGGIFLVNFQLGLWEYNPAKIKAGFLFYVFTGFAVMMCVTSANARDRHKP